MDFVKQIRGKSIDIVLTIDDSYVMHCGTVMASVFANNTPHKINIHIINIGLSALHKQQLGIVARRFGQRLFIYDVEEKVLGKLQSTTVYISNASFLRLFIHRLLPNDIDKVLYLDCDLVVRKDLAELWDTDITDYMVAGVEDAPIFKHQQRLGYDQSFPYINAGVILVNLKKWRDEDVSAKFDRIIEDNNGIFEFNDQDILNLTFHEQTLILPVKWNMLDCFFTTPPLATPKYVHEIVSYRDNPSIVHFSGWAKPWIRHEVPFGMEYFHYIKFTPWKSFARKVYTRIWKRKIGDLTGIRPLLKKLRGKHK